MKKKRSKTIERKCYRKITQYKSTTKNDSYKITKKKHIFQERMKYFLHHQATARHILQMVTIMQYLEMTSFVN